MVANWKVTAKYVPDNKSFGAFMVSKDVKKVAVQAAEDIATLAAVAAPRSSNTNPSHRHFADDFKVDAEAADVSLAGNPRATANVYNNNDHALQAEFGTSKQRGHRTLGQVGAAVGEMRGQPG